MNGEVLTRKWKDLTFHLPRKNDSYTFKEILGELDQYRLELILPLLRPDDIVIDLGAHIGLFSLAVAKQVGQVIALEPEEENCEIFEKNIKENCISNVSILQKAIAKEKGDREFYRSLLSPARHSFFSNSFFNGFSFASEKILIPTTTLSEIFKDFKKCKILKADIEGAEYEVFLNSPPELLKRIQMFFIEYHNFSDSCTGNVLSEFFRDLGFVVTEGNQTTHRTRRGELTCGSLFIINPFLK